MIWFQHALLQRDQGEPHVEWITWFLSSPLRLRSEEYRQARLGPDPSLWRSQLFELWSDIWHRSAEVQIFVVSPEPARAEHQDHAGHLLLVQGDIPHQVPALVTMIFQSTLGHRLAHVAAYLPTFVQVPELLQLLRLGRVCQDRGCYVTIDGQNIPEFGVGRVEAGDNVQLTAPPRRSDHTALLQIGMQRSNTKLPVVQLHRP